MNKNGGTQPSRSFFFSKNVLVLIVLLEFFMLISFGIASRTRLNAMSGNVADCQAELRSYQVSMRKLSKDSIACDSKNTSNNKKKKNDNDDNDNSADADDADDDEAAKKPILDTEALCAELIDKERRQCKNKQKECLDQLEISSNEIEKVYKIIFIIVS